ncbi:MAG: DUF4957 domain-containing protein [Alistipes sp.]|nr:DUF4957 domain-containing protein [Alistipes sp.]
MKKMTLKMRLLSGLVIVSIALAAGSCAQGADCDEVFSAGVTNTQLESPELDNSSFTPFETEEGMKLQVSWPVVYGAGGYEVKVANAETPEELLFDAVVDGCTVMVPGVAEYQTYAVSVKTLGNKRYNNSEAQTASAYNYTVAPTRISLPSSCEISTYITEHYQAPTAPSLGVIYQLEAGGTYTLDAPIDFNVDKVQLLGDAENRPTITISGSGALLTQAGLQVRNINFDCTSATNRGLIMMSPNPNSKISTANLGYKADGANQDCFVIVDPIIFADCWVKNLPNAFLDDNQKKYALADFRIDNSIIQLKNEGTNGFIKFDKGGYLIQKMTWTNSTIYNSVQNDNEVYAIRFSNQSNAQPKKVFGNSRNFLEYTIKDCTIARIFPKKDWANNLPNTQNNNKLWCHIENTLFFDIYRLEKFIQSQWYTTTPNNVLFCSPKAKYNANDASKKDKLGNAWTLNEDPGFTETSFPALRLDAPNGGLNLKATSGTLAPTIGDPRWLN